MHDTIYRRVADTAPWVYYVAHTCSESCMCMHVTINCFAAEAATDQIMSFIILYGNAE
jgi:hypothetical protein